MFWFYYDVWFFIFIIFFLSMNIFPTRNPIVIFKRNTFPEKILDLLLF